ncbi:MAG: tetratricopeptide repeat protein [Burkholderiales bacterium]
MDASLVQELVWIKWVLVAIAAALVVLALSTLGALWGVAKMPELIKGRASFADRAKQLLDKGALDELLELCDRHTAEFPADANAYWFQAQADYRRGKFRRALSALHHVRELQPDWDAVYTNPMISAIEDKLSTEGDRPDLKIVTPSPPPDDDTPPSRGT